MIPNETISEAIQRLTITYNPLYIYLFGSYAWGIPHKDSDLDILVILDTSHEKLIKRSASGYQALFGLNIAKDIIVYTEEEFEKAAQNTSSLSYRIKKEGEKVYARA